MTSEPFSDLIYDDKTTAEWFREQWPDVDIEDARDAIHTDRFSVTIPGVTSDDVYPVMIAHGFALVSLGLSILLRTPEHEATCQRWLDEAKALIGTGGSNGTS